MNFHISRVRINNFRNFIDLDVRLADKVVIVGENQVGKTNFLHALRLVLDPELPDSARMLREEDFCDSLKDPMNNGKEIVVAVDLCGFGSNERLLSILSDNLIADGDVPTARITYKFSPVPIIAGQEQKEGKPQYSFVVFGGTDESNFFGYQHRKWMTLARMFLRLIWSNSFLQSTR